MKIGTNLYERIVFGDSISLEHDHPELQLTIFPKPNIHVHQTKVATKRAFIKVLEREPPDNFGFRLR